jgi:3-hydroxyisobutyrate dehydrogenase
MLEEGAEKSKCDFHLASFSTISEDGPKNRTVVLRRVIKEKNVLIFHTDKRSSKVNEINSNPNISWLFYSHSKKVQLRLEGEAVVYSYGKLWEDQWNSTALMSRKCYLVDHAPSSIIKHPEVYLTNYSQFKNISIEDSQIGKENFAVVKTKINSIDWLYLKSSGHVRAKFNLENEIMQGKWLVP